MINKLIKPVFLKKHLQQLVFLSLIPLTMNAQDLKEVEGESMGLYSYVQQKYGLDQELVTGVQFFNDYPYVLNHPFYRGEKYLPGDLTKSGKEFDQLLLNYDIYNQCLVLDYPGLPGGTQKIILEPRHTDAFHIDGLYFERLVLDKRGPLFYQVLKKKGITLYIHWDKRLRQTSGNMQYAKSFSDPIRTYFLEYNESIISFSSRRDFSAAFPESHQQEIRGYLRKNKIHFQQVKLDSLYELLEFADSISQ